MNKLTNCFRLLIALVLTGLLLGCNEDTPEKLAAQTAVKIESGEECHLCGMIITNYPGPKGQLYERGRTQTHKFCSTRDMFAYLLDPENTHNIQTAYVHDMAVTPWDHPDDETYIDARKAWYVVGSNKKGAMGPTLGSFATEKNAKAFTEINGGQLYTFAQLDLELISSMGF
ncbi:MAG: nitrous oxide reductase accessory protein NosL [Motiliproteus sp.]|nr:nitrous oxide reductase accessory protein NosL [Motiliproteus sp.]MCW9053358.1 nitrous oxide reductase accessory protein NosL [Motiliproteus sp.]